MALVRTIPQTLLPSSGSFGANANIPSDVDQFVLTVTQVSWPFAGDTALEYALEWSNDSGATWTFIAGEEVDDVPQSTVRGSINNQFKVSCTLPNVGSSTRRCRIRWFNCKAGITISGTIEANVAPVSAKK